MDVDFLRVSIQFFWEKSVQCDVIAIPGFHHLPIFVIIYFDLRISILCQIMFVSKPRMVSSK